MIFRTLFYYIEKLLIVIATCIVACLLFILIAYLPFKKLENIWRYSFFEGAMGMWIDRHTVILASGVRTNREGYEMVRYELERMGVTPNLK